MLVTHRLSIHSDRGGPLIFLAVLISSSWPRRPPFFRPAARASRANQTPRMIARVRSIIAPLCDALRAYRGRVLIDQPRFVRLPPAPRDSSMPARHTTLGGQTAALIQIKNFIDTRLGAKCVVKAPFFRCFDGAPSPRLAQDPAVSVEMSDFLLTLKKAPEFSLNRNEFK